MSEENTNKQQDILEAVYQIVLERKQMADGEKSYVKSLFDKGLDKILTKIGEEATETAIAGKGGDKEEVVYEIADLIFHTLVLMGYYEIEPEKVYEELRRRFGMSGIEEKNSRTK
jgi:phosphoribosyl-ATP pyrophosphohydrolase